MVRISLRGVSHDVDLGKLVRIGGNGAAENIESIFSCLRQNTAVTLKEHLVLEDDKCISVPGSGSYSGNAGLIEPACYLEVELTGILAGYIVGGYALTDHRAGFIAFRKLTRVDLIYGHILRFRGGSTRVERLNENTPFILIET